MKNLFNKKKETEEVTEETEENTTPVEGETEKKKTVPTWLKVTAAGVGVVLGAVGLSKIFGHGSEPIDWSDLDEMGSEITEETDEAPSESTEVSAESAE